MLSKKSTRKVSFLLAASLLTAAVPATTQAGWKKGVGFSALGIWCGKKAYDTARSSYFAGKIFVATEKVSDMIGTPVFSKQMRENTIGVFQMNAAFAIIAGIAACFCFKTAYNNFFGKKDDSVTKKETPKQDDDIDQVFTDAFSLDSVDFKILKKST